MLSWAFLLCLFGAVELASAQQSVSHFGGGYGGYNGGRGPALSKYNPATKNYEPVTSDKQYIYYRLRINLDQTFQDIFMPDPSSPSVVSIVMSGDTYDNSTGVKVGTWDSYTVSTAPKATGEVQQYLVTLAAEYGPEGDDAIFYRAALDRADLIGEITDFDLAVVGGTGRYKGATGEAQHSGIDATSREKGNLYVIELAVPKFKRF